MLNERVSSTGNTHEVIHNPEQSQPPEPETPPPPPPPSTQERDSRLNLLSLESSMARARFMRDFSLDGSDSRLQSFSALDNYRPPEPPPPPSPEERIERLRELMPHLPPEDQQVIQDEIRGIELTEMASDPAEVDRMANDIINRHGGSNHVAIGAELAEIANLSPEAARALMENILPKMAEDDRDELAQSFVESFDEYGVATANLSDAELSKLAQDPDGRALLENIQNLLTVDQNGDEGQTAARVEMALQSVNNTLDEQIEASAGRVREAWESLDTNAVPNALASEIERLDALYGYGSGAKLIEKLIKDDPEEFANMMRFAGQGSAEQQRTIGIALGNAYENLSPEEQQSFAEALAQWTIADAFTPRTDGTEPTGIANLVANGFNDDLKRAVVNEMMEAAEGIEPGLFGDNGGVDVKALFNGAAIIAQSGGSDLQVELFDTIIKTLPEVNLPSLMNDPQLKDRLSQLFIDNSTDILHSLTAENGRFLDSQSLDGLRQFFELTLFSKDGGQLRESLMGSVINSISQFADPQNSSSVGRNKEADEYVAGSLIGLVQSAALNQKDAINSEQESREETVKFFTGLAFAAVPGASRVLGEGSGAILEFAYNKAKEFAQSHAGSGIANFINNMLDGDALENIDEGFKAIRDMRFAIESDVLGNSTTLANAFGLGYAETGVDQLFLNLFGE